MEKLLTLIFVAFLVTSCGGDDSTEALEEKIEKMEASKKKLEEKEKELDEAMEELENL